MSAVAWGLLVLCLPALLLFVWVLLRVVDSAEQRWQRAVREHDRRYRDLLDGRWYGPASERDDA